MNENGNVQFLYQLIEQGAAQSFGIHVAKLAGLPHEILQRSSEILSELEAHKDQTNLPLNKVNHNQLDMFAAPPQVVTQEKPSAIMAQLQELDILNMTPIQALQKLHELKSDYIN